LRGSSLLGGAKTSLGSPIRGLVEPHVGGYWVLQGRRKPTEKTGFGPPEKRGCSLCPGVWVKSLFQVVVPVGSGNSPAIRGEKPGELISTEPGWVPFSPNFPGFCPLWVGGPIQPRFFSQGAQPRGHVWGPGPFFWHGNFLRRVFSGSILEKNPGVVHSPFNRGELFLLPGFCSARQETGVFNPWSVGEKHTSSGGFSLTPSWSNWGPFPW